MGKMLNRARFSFLTALQTSHRLMTRLSDGATLGLLSVMCVFTRSIIFIMQIANTYTYEDHLAQCYRDVN